MKLFIIVLLACASCRASSSTGDAGAPVVAASKDALLERMVTLEALHGTLDRVLRHLPAARDEAQDVIRQLTEVRARVGDKEVAARMLPFKDRPVRRSAATEQAFNTVLAYQEKWKSADLEMLVTSDAGALSVSADLLRSKADMLRKATVLLEEVDRARFELAVLTNQDAGQ